METVGDRIRALRKSKDLSQPAFGRLFDVQGQAVSQWERNLGIKRENLEKIAAHFGISGDWLSTGLGEKFRQTNDGIPNMGYDTRPTQVYIPEFEVRNFTMNALEMDDSPERESWSVPGKWISGEMQIGPHAAVIFGVEGIAMSPVLEPGDRVIIDTASTDPGLESIYAVLDRKTVLIRYVQMVRGGSPDRIICRCANPAFGPIELILDSVTKIIGRVVGRISRM
jgi:phage repressor protein C with HTH and peptisase S24 domain